jgi:histidinol-phosphate/aromatic aminotransferase/cobyric acid decarboxylase-like protein
VRFRLTARPPATHGGAAKTQIDLSASHNPLGSHPGALEAARACELGRYPEPEARQLARAAALRHGLPERIVVPVPGAAWGLWLCSVALIGPGDTCLGLGPCFGENRRSLEIAGAEYREVRAWPPLASVMLRELEVGLAGRPTLCMIANPGNPTGVAMAAGDVRSICAEHPDTAFIIDEAFAAFAPAGTSLVDGSLPPSNAVVVRSLTKELGLPGLRMGYLIAGSNLADHLAGILPAWPLSAPAIAAAVAGTADLRHVEAGAQLARRHLEQLAPALASTGAAPLESDANYLLAHAPGAGEALRQAGVTVRDCASFDLPGHIRLGAPKPEEMARVLSAIAELGVLVKPGDG